MALPESLSSYPSPVENHARILALRHLSCSQVQTGGSAIVKAHRTQDEDPPDFDTPDPAFCHLSLTNLHRTPQSCSYPILSVSTMHSKPRDSTHIRIHRQKILIEISMDIPTKHKPILKRIDLRDSICVVHVGNPSSMSVILRPKPHSTHRFSFSSGNIWAGSNIAQFPR